MITLRKHIEMMESISKTGSANEYLSKMKPIDYVDFSRNLEKCYPIKQRIKKPKTNKRLYTNVESLVLGQFIMLEQIITGKTKLPDHLVDLEIAKLVIRPQHHNSFDNENQTVTLDADNETVGDITWFGVSNNPKFNMGTG